MKLDGLVFVDCWGEKWINECNPVLGRRFYSELLEFTELYAIDKVFYEKDNTHHWIVEKYPDAYDNDLQTIRNNLPEFSNILVCGAAWGKCLHNTTEQRASFPNLSLNGGKQYNLYSHPCLVDSAMHSAERIVEQDFLTELWIPVLNLYKFPGQSKSS